MFKNKRIFLFRILLLSVLLFSSRVVFGQTEASVSSGALFNVMHSKVALVKQNAGLAASAAATEASDWPKGMIQDMGGYELVAVLDSCFNKVDGLHYLVALVELIPKQSGQDTLSFMSTKVPFGAFSVMNSSLIKLYLVKDIKLLSSENGVNINLKGGESASYLEWDCQKSFAGMQLSGEVELSKEYFNNLEQPGSSVKSSFSVYVSDLSNVLLSVSLPTLGIKGMEGLSIKINKATLDFSETNNATGFSLPADYDPTYSSNVKLWKGLYAEEISVGWQPSFGSKKYELSGTKMLIDELGVTGTFTLESESSEKDKLSGWDMTLSKAGIRLLKSELVGGNLSGNLSVPFLGNAPIPYTAQMVLYEDDVDYLFSATIPSSQVFSTAMGEMKLSSGTVISIDRYEGKYEVSLLMAGEFNFKKDVLNLEKIRFERLSIHSTAPYIRDGVFSYGGTISAGIAGYGVAIKELKLGIDPRTAGIVIKGRAIVSLMDTSDKGFSGSTSFTINIDGPKSNVEQEYKFNKVEIGQIEIKASVGGCELEGLINLRVNDPTYGDGFGGKLRVKIKALSGLDVMGVGDFGKVEDYRYFRVYFQAKSSGTIITLGVLDINGLGGGLSYHMVPDLPTSDKVDVRKLVEGGEVKYLPKKSASIGIKIYASAKVKSESLGEAQVSIEVIFNNSGGVSNMNMLGGLTMLKSAISAYVLVNMDVEKDIFHAQADAYMNMVFIKGGGEKDKLGTILIHKDSKDWYIYAGRPSDRNSIDIIGLAKVDGYFCMGSVLDPFPAPPAKIQALAKECGASLAPPNASLAAASGGGVAFGMNFHSDFKIDAFLFAQFDFDIGGDFLLKNYGSGTTCLGQGPIGINGWYAQGQAYIYLQGVVGVKVNDWHLDIVNGAAAMILQAELPNPTWVHGDMMLKYSIMGGLIKGKKKFDFELGSRCTLNQDPDAPDPNEVKLIGDIRPAPEAQEVNVFASPQVAFNSTIEKEVETIAGDKREQYRVRLVESKLMKGNTEVAGAKSIGLQNDQLTYMPKEILEGNTSYSFRVKIALEKKDSYGNWKPAPEMAKGEVKESTFKTGAQPQKIVDENIVNMYPLKDQYNFYRKQYGQGFIRLARSQEYLMKGYQVVAKFVSVQDKKSQESEVYYSQDTGRIYYTIPEELKGNTVYNLQIVQRAKSTANADNVQRTSKLSESKDGSSVEIRQNTLQGDALSSSSEKVLYEYYFRTSSYETLQKKLSAIAGERLVLGIEEDVQDYVFGLRFRLEEPFEEREVSEYVIQSEADAFGASKHRQIELIAQTDNEWFSQSIYPMLYYQYPWAGDIQVSREQGLLGIPPLKAVELYTGDFSEPASLGEESKLSGLVESSAPEWIIAYELSPACARDYGVLKNKLINHKGELSASGANLLYKTKSYPGIMPGNYKIKIYYYIPDEKPMEILTKNIPYR